MRGYAHHRPSGPHRRPAGLGGAELFQQGLALTVTEATRRRRVGAISSSVMISCALTLPTFGKASSSADTFILPKTSSLSASLRTWVRLVPPRLSRSLSSARARRAAAAFSNAAARCSSVNWGRATIPPSLIDINRSLFVPAGYAGQRRRPYSGFLTKSNPTPWFWGQTCSVGVARATGQRSAGRPRRPLDGAPCPCRHGWHGT